MQWLKDPVDDGYLKIAHQNFIKFDAENSDVHPAHESVRCPPCTRVSDSTRSRDTARHICTHPSPDNK